MSSVQRRVCFLFAGQVLEGDVVDEAPRPRFNDRDRVELSVDVPGRGTYRVLNSDTVDVEAQSR